VDRVPGLGNAWFTSGHYRTGILMGPATGSALARWITSGARPAEVERFGLHRPGFLDHRRAARHISPAPGPIT
jgi:glycine/D-amino acid oxidase-like deaminating enzyme